MNKVNLSLTAILLSVTLVSGCSGNNVRSQNVDNYRNHPITQNRGHYRPLDVGGATSGNTANTPSGSVENKFSDVPSSEWFAEHVLWGSNLGIIDGYPDGTFQPNKSMTRAEVIKIIKSLADKGYLTAPSGGTTPTTPGGTTAPGDATTPGGTTTTTPGDTTTTTPGGTTTAPGGATTTP